MKIKHAGFAAILLMAMSLNAETSHTAPPPPVLAMPGSSKPLAAKNSPKTFVLPKTSGAGAAAVSIPSVQMKILVLAGESTEYSYQAITTFLTHIGVPYTGIAVNTLTPDSHGNRLSNLALVDPGSGQGLYQGIIETNSNFSVCNPNCTALLSSTDWNTLDAYASQFQTRVVSYYTWPEAKWGLSPVGSGASHSSSNPLQVTLTTAGASIFSYINSANPIPVAGSGGGSIWAYQASPVAALGETTTPILKVGTSTVGVTHTTADGRESLSLTFDNYPTLLHSLAFSYGVINWVTKGVFLGARQIYINPQDDDILYGDRLYAPTLPQCPDDPACPDVEMTSADLHALRNWQISRQTDPQFSYLRTTFAYVGVGATFGPVYTQEAQTMAEEALDYGWVSHGYVHADADCFTVSPGGTCIPATLQQALRELQVNHAFASALGLPGDFTGLVTPFNNGLGNQAYLQAASWLGITSVVSPLDPPTPNTGYYSSLAPSIYLIPRRVTNLLWNVSSPSTGVFGSLPDEYNSLYGPNGSTPFFSEDQTYSQILSNESDGLMLLRLLTYEPYPLGFHTANSVTYDGIHSLMTDLLDATIQKYKKLYNLPVQTLKAMRDIAPLLKIRETYNASGVTGVYTPGVSVVLTTVNPATIPVTGACAQSVCPLYGGQMQDHVSMAAHSSVTLSLSAGTGVALSAVSANPASVGSLSPSQGLVTLNGVATANTVISLSSNNAMAVVPASVTVLPGDLGASFPITSGAVSSPTTATITATSSGVTRSTTVTITPAIALSGVTLSPGTVSGGSSSTATVTLNAAAPAGGFVISLISNNNAATTPSTVTVPSGNSTATFTVSTSAVTGTTTGNIVAIYNSVIRTAPLTVTTGSAITLSDVFVNPSQVAGGTSSAGTVTLSGPAPAGGIQITLSSNDASATVPPGITVPAGSSSANFSVTTTAVGSTETATISAVYNGITRTADLTIAPVTALSGVSLNPTTVIGGSPSTGTVTLTAPAPTGGIAVSLTSDGAATVPANVTVATGNTTATFTVTTQSVSSPSSATITASTAGVTKTATLTITAGTALSAVSLNPASVIGGSPSTGTVTLNQVAPAGGIAVALSSNSSSATVPANVTVATGNTTATFTVTTQSVSSPSSATITASAAGVTKTAPLTITVGTALSAVSLNPASVIGGSPSTGTVTLNQAAPAGGIAVALSSNSSSATVPVAVTVAAGQNSATFTIATQTVASTVNAVISASYSGVIKTAILAVTPNATLSTFTVSPVSMSGGNPATGTVKLAAPAPGGGVPISLSSNSSAAPVPPVVTVPAGSTSASFTIATTGVTADTIVVLTATLGSTAKTASLSLWPAVYTNFSLNPATVAGGTQSIGTVIFTGAAPAGGFVVTLSSNNPLASVPPTVTVPAGSLSATFPVTTHAANYTAKPSITGTFQGKTISGTLTIIGLTSLSVSPTSVKGGNSSTGTVKITGAAPAGGAVVALSSSNVAAVVPATVTIPAGSSSAKFTITTKTVSTSTNASISAAMGGLTNTASLTITH